jgi:hypothetical protein
MPALDQPPMELSAIQPLDLQGLEPPQPELRRPNAPPPPTQAGWGGADDDLPLPVVQPRGPVPGRPKPTQAQAMAQSHQDLDLDAPELPPAGPREEDVALPPPRAAEPRPQQGGATGRPGMLGKQPQMPVPPDPYAGHEAEDGSPPPEPRPAAQGGPVPLGPLPNIAPVQLPTQRRGFGSTQLGVLLAGATPIMAVSSLMAALLRPEFVRLSLTIAAVAGFLLGLVLVKLRNTRLEEAPPPLLREGNAGNFLGRLGVATGILCVLGIGIAFGAAKLTRHELRGQLQRAESQSAFDDRQLASLLDDLARGGTPLPDPEFGMWPDKADAEKQCKQQRLGCDASAAGRWIEEHVESIDKVMGKTATFRMTARGSRELHFAWISFLICLGVWATGLRDPRLSPVEQAFQIAGLWLTTSLFGMWAMAFVSPLMS